MKYRLSILAGVFIVLLTLCSCVRMSAVVTERPADLSVFFTSDTRGMLRRCGCSEGQLGGLSARATYLNGQRVAGGQRPEGEKMLVFDAGDTLFDRMDLKEGAREFYALKARTVYKAMEQSGYDAVTFGEYDFAYGPDFLADALNGFALWPLEANVSMDAGGAGTLIYKKGLIKNFHGLTVGVIGIMDNAFPFDSFKQSFRGVSVSDPYEAAQRQIDDLRGKADLVVVLAHLSVTDPEGFVKRLKGADLVIQGHSQEVLDKPGRIGGTLLVKGFDKGKHIGRLDLWLEDQKREDGRVGKVIKGYKYAVIAVDESIPPSPRVEEIISDYRRELHDRKFASEEPEPWGAGWYVGPDACMGCHGAQYRNWSGTGHARALKSLAKTGDQYDPECLPCHTTGYGYATGYNSLGASPSLGNVTCEACHGRGGPHASGIKPAPFSPVTATVRRAVGEETCRGCHDDYNSPNFDYEVYKAKGGAHRGGAEPVR